MNYPGEDQDNNFIQEKIKDRPVNKKKLIRRTIITASMAVIFGLVACLTFLVLEPLFSNWLYPEEEPKQVEFPEEKNEMLPEDMLIDETLQDNGTQIESVEERQESLNAVDSYKAIYTELYALAQENRKAMVTVTGITPDIDWFNNSYETRDHTSGVIAANNGKEYLMLVDKKSVENVDSIWVTFFNGFQVQAQLKKADPVTKLAVIAVETKDVSAETAEQIKTAVLGSSNNTSVLGSPVMVLGSPYGAENSLAYGMVTSMGNVLHLPDSSYKLLMTDIYGSTGASGILLNLDGQVIGMINEQYNSEEMGNQLCAIGISELKTTIERLSNGKAQAYVGIFGTDVTAEISAEYEVPVGAYVTEIEMDSPAMQAGIQSGDVIVGINEEEVLSYEDYISQLRRLEPEGTMEFKVMRQGQNEYREMTVSVVTKAVQ